MSANLPGPTVIYSYGMTHTVIRSYAECMSYTVIWYDSYIHTGTHVLLLGLVEKSVYRS